LGCHEPRGLALRRLTAVEDDTRQLDRFELVAELATGGMATVYLARVSGVGGFQRFVAIKRLHPHLAREPEFIEMFLDEARLAARIHHPNVVSILEIGASEQGYYIVMEYVEGDTLGRLLARSAQIGQRLPLDVGLRIVIDTLAGLEAAHELNDDEGNPLLIVHRDVSPQNVLVGVDGNARLTDFGVARATSRLSITRAGQLKGKVAYMAPEQARGEAAIDHRADVFAAGIILWEVLGGKRLFKAEGEAQTLNRVLSDPIPPVQTAWPGVPPGLADIVAKSLERDRNLRYQSALELAEDLEKAAHDLGVDATNRDVAAYLEEALGPEITSQREAVRAWVARTTDSGRRSHAQTPGPAQASTRLERRVGSLPPPPSVSGVASLPPPPRVPSLLAQKGGPAQAVPSAAATTPEGVGAGAPTSSDSLPRSADSTRPHPLQPSEGAAVWPWLMLVAATLAGGLAWVLWTRARPAATPPPVPVAATSAAPATDRPLVAPEPAAPPSRTPVEAPPPAAAAPGAAFAEPAASPRLAAPRAPHPSEPPAAPTVAPNGGSSAATGKPSTPADDISRNPYR
jgi:eukaryotic-like serine/threonine-protein kinase